MTKGIKEASLLLVMLVCIIGIALGITACAKQHVHSFSTEWSSNEYQHYHVCAPAAEKEYECGAIKDMADHEMELKGIIKAPSCFEEGEGTYVCKICNYSEKRAIPTTPHNFDEALVSEKGHSFVCKNEGCNHTSNFEEHEAAAPQIKAEATAHAAGLKETYCKDCNYLLKSEIVPATLAPVGFEVELKKYVSEGDAPQADDPEPELTYDSVKGEYTADLFGDNIEGNRYGYIVSFKSGKDYQGNDIAVDFPKVEGYNNYTGYGVYVYIVDEITNELISTGDGAAVMVEPFTDFTAKENLNILHIRVAGEYLLVFRYEVESPTNRKERVAMAEVYVRVTAAAYGIEDLVVLKSMELKSIKDENMQEVALGTPYNNEYNIELNTAIKDEWDYDIVQNKYCLEIIGIGSDDNDLEIRDAFGAYGLYYFVEDENGDLISYADEPTLHDTIKIDSDDYGKGVYLGITEAGAYKLHIRWMAGGVRYGNEIVLNITVTDEAA